MTERLRLKLARVVTAEPPRHYRTREEMPAQCPRVGCGALLKPWPDGKVCSACGRGSGSPSQLLVESTFTETTTNPSQNSRIVGCKIRKTEGDFFPA
jgi:hypothetical protein